MYKFEQLGKEINDICKVDNIGFKWTYDDKSCCYKLSFKKSGKKFNLMINDKDLYYIPHSLIKGEIAYKLYKFNNAA